MEQKPYAGPQKSAEEKLQGMDRVEVGSRVVQAATGLTVGVAVSGTVAQMAGVATVFGSTTLATMVGGAFAVTPLGWVIGSGVALGALAYGLGAAIADGAKNTERRKRLIRDLNVLKSQESRQPDQTSLEVFQQRIQRAVDSGQLKGDLAARLLGLIAKGALELSVAKLRLDDLLKVVAIDPATDEVASNKPTNVVDEVAVLQESPEILVGALLERMHSLRGAATFLNDSALIERLVTVTRRLTLTNVLSRQPVIAVAGSQGAGKTTLVKTLYGLDDQWLSGNEGRGERSPLLIVENPDVDGPKASILVQALVEDGNQLRFLQQEVEATPDDFRKALLGEYPNQLLPKLTVPSRYFDGNACGLLLLPGHEIITKKNKGWQDLMRQSLVGSDMCVIVTDETRLANNEQSKILEDFGGQLSGSCPIVVIAKTEGKTPEQLDVLSAAAARAFGLNGQAASERVICSGVELEGASQWQGKLATAMQNLTHVKQTFRARQLHQLHEVLTEELSEILVDIDMSCREASLNGAHFGGPVQEILKAFDLGKSRLRREYIKELKQTLNVYSNDSVQRALNALSGHEEGLLNGVQNSWRWLRTTTGERENILPSYVENAWQAPWRLDTKAVKGFGHFHQKAMARVTMDLLGAPRAVRATSSSQGWSPQQELGYHSTGRTPICWKSPSPRQKLDLARIFSDDGKSVDLSPEMLDAVQLLPVVALEYSRIGSLFPSLFGVNHQSLMFHAADGDENSSQKLASIIGEQGVAILTVIGSMVGVNAAFDVLEELGSDGGFGTAANATSLVQNLTQLGVSVGLVGSMTAMLGAGFLVMNLAKSIQHSEGQARDVVRRMTAAIADAHFAHFSSEFDHVMDRLREQLEYSLRKRYRMDEQVVRLDRLKKTYADVQMLSTELRESLARNTSFTLV